VQGAVHGSPRRHDALAQVHKRCQTDSARDSTAEYSHQLRVSLSHSSDGELLCRTALWLRQRVLRIRTFHT
jgi:hypothetical protein